MAIAQVVAGAYTSSYNAIGITGENPLFGSVAGFGFNDENGFELEQQTHGEMVDRSDLYGQSLLDWVHQGGSVFITFTCMTFQNRTDAIKNVFYPWAPFGVMADAAIPIGRLASNVAQELILTAVPSTPAATAGPLTMTAPKAILPPNTNSRLMFSTRVRRVPCRLALLPWQTNAGGTVRWWTEA